MRSRFVQVVVVITFYLLQVAPANASSCDQSIQDKNLALALDLCFPNARESWGWDPSGSDKFGSQTKPSKSSLLAAKLAEQGNPDFQFFYALVLENYIHQLPIRENYELVEKLRSERKLLLRKSAEGGQLHSMYLHISRVYTSAKNKISIGGDISAEDKSAALRYLDSFDLKETNFPSDIKTVIQQMNTVESPAPKLLIEDTENYSSLPEDKLFELANAVRFGDFGNEVRTPDPERSAPMFELLIAKYRNTAAAVIYRNDITDKSRQVELMRWASGLQNMDALVWYGAYLVCNSKSVEGVELLKKAEVAGKTSATLVLKEIAQEGVPANCYQGWLY